MTEKNFVENLDDYFNCIEQPRMGYGGIAQYFLSKEISKNYKVVLTGHGGDELFSGYPIYKISNFFDSKKISKLFNFNFSEIPQLIYFVSSYFSKEKLNFMPTLFKERSTKINNLNFTKEFNQSSINNSNQENVFLNYLNIYLPGLLEIEDKTSMRFGLESRVPFLDNYLTDLSFSLSFDDKIKNGNLKAILKDQIYFKFHNLSKVMNFKKKIGFSVPVNEWFFNSYKNYFYEKILNTNNIVHNFLDKSEIKKIIYLFYNPLIKKNKILHSYLGQMIWQLISIDKCYDNINKLVN